MRGGFTFQLITNKYRPRLQIKHLNNRAALIQFAQPAQQSSTRSLRKHRFKIPAHRGYFLDIKTLGSALFSRSWSLESLARFLKTKNQKHSTEEHGKTLSEKYLKYAMQDVQVTWECFQSLKAQYERFELSDTPITRIYSEASLGKGYLAQMGITPWCDNQRDFSSEILGAFMSSYYGGRAEVHIRHQVVQVLYCDFLSMYPTVCTLMGLWKFVIAERVDLQDATQDVKNLLDNITLDDLKNPRFWKQLNVLVQIHPNDDILPVRAPYSLHSNQLSIGVNHLKSTRALWFTLADCVASVFLNGRTPNIVKAMRFVPVGIQKGLRPTNLMGDPTYRVDPARDDFYKRLIDLRSEVKARMKISSGQEKEELDVEQLALKICANATSYGIFVEFNTKEHDRYQKVTCYGYEKPFATYVKSVEEPGKYFHPIIATFINWRSAIDARHN